MSLYESTLDANSWMEDCCVKIFCLAIKFQGFFSFPRWVCGMVSTLGGKMSLEHCDTLFACQTYCFWTFDALPNLCTLFMCRTWQCVAQVCPFPGFSSALLHSSLDFCWSGVISHANWLCDKHLITLREGRRWPGQLSNTPLVLLCDLRLTLWLQRLVLHLCTV